MSQYSHLSIIDPEFAKASALAPRPDPADSVVEMRQRFDIMTKMVNERDKALFPPESALRVEEHKVPVANGEITVRCMVPTPAGGSAGSFPLLVNYHGGGYTVGNLEHDDLWLRQVCVEQQVSVVNVGYRHAPEFPWPIPQNDCYTGLKWAAEHATLLSADLSKGFIVGGTSAGGNASASLALRTIDDPLFEGRPLTGQLLQIPAIIHPRNVPDKYKAELLSMDMPIATGFLDKRAVLEFYDFWKPDKNDINTWPLLHPKHARVAPAVFQICGLDPLRDEALLYEKLLNEAGVRTRLHVYTGVPHGFHTAFAQIKLAKEYLQDRKDGLRWLLSGAA